MRESLCRTLEIDPGIIKIVILFCIHKFQKRILQNWIFYVVITRTDLEFAYYQFEYKSGGRMDNRFLGRIVQYEIM